MATISYSHARDIQKKHGLNISNVRFEGTADGMHFIGKYVCDATSENKRLQSNLNKIYSQRLADMSNSTYCSVNGAITAAVEYFKTNKLFMKDATRNDIRGLVDKMYEEGVAPTDYSAFVSSLIAKENTSEFTESMYIVLTQKAIRDRDLHFAFFAAKMMYEESVKNNEVELPKFEKGQAIEINGILRSAREVNDYCRYPYIEYEIEQDGVTFIKHGSQNIFKDTSIDESVHFYTKVKYVAKSGLVYIDRVAKHPY